MTKEKGWAIENRERLIEVLVHVLAWGLYTAFWFLNNAFMQLSPWHRFFYLMDILIFDLSIFYYLYLIAIPQLLRNRKTWMFVIMVIAILGLYPFFKHMADSIIGSYFPDESTVMSRIASAGFWQAYLIRVLSCLFVVIMAALGRFTFDWFRNMRIRAELENQNLTSELAFLKSQINPHFLFNTLNNIHTLAYKKSDMAPDSIMKLSDLMRYMIYESNADLVPLEKELVHLRSFIDLQSLRFRERDIVNFQTAGDHSNHMIAPLLLLPFAENAFKHGADLNSREAISITLNSLNDSVEFQITNRTNTSKKVQKDGVGGIGLENIKRRLELIYPDRYTLAINESSTQYRVKLTIRTNG